MNSFAVAVLANAGRGMDPDIVKPGWLAMGIVALMGVAVFLLARSFLKHSRRSEQPWEGEGPRDDSSWTVRPPRQ